MSFWAARVTDLHLCLKIEPGGVPHVGGPIVPEGAPTVWIANEHAAREGDKAQCFGLPGPPSDSIKEGEDSVLICGEPAARLLHATEHGGFIILGCPTVLIGSSPQGLALSAATRTGFADECETPGGAST
jgi:uncharacterized Zn-binding protein involved in type VI secretion